MNNKKRAFTLVELLAVVAISAILLFIATDRLIGDSFRANATYNQRVDVQTGVKTSMDNIKSILKRSVQVHLVGKEVYMEDMDLTKLDNKYNYIAFRKDSSGNRFLANIVYDKATNKFNVLPLTAGDKKDIMTGDNIDYNLEFYKNDNNYRKKLEKDMLNITITGKSSANVLGKGINDKFELKEDIQLPNVNQILLSRHLQGGIDKITALAYDNGVIQPGKKGSGGKVGFVFVMDSSSSMKYTMTDEYAFRMSDGTYRIAYGPSMYSLNRGKLYPTVYSKADIEDGDDKKGVSTRKVILGHAMVNNFLPKVHELAVSKNLEIESYIFDYNSQLQDYKTNRNTGIIAEPSNHSLKYFTTLEMANKRGYGPLKLETDAGFKAAKDLVRDKANMKLTESDHTNWGPVLGQGTNTGFALLTALEILQQMKEQGIENRYLILLTDGVPQAVEYISPGSSIPAVNRASYNLKRAGALTVGHPGESFAMSYINQVTNSDNGNNPKDLYKKAYLIGLSGVPSELARLGFPDASGNVPRNSINAYLAQTGNIVRTYNASDKNALNDALEAIVTDIGVSMGVFDGPDKMK